MSPKYPLSFRFKDTAQKTRDDLVKLGFPEFTIDDFHENVSKTVTLTKNRSPIYRISILLNREKTPQTKIYCANLIALYLKAGHQLLYCLGMLMS